MIVCCGEALIDMLPRELPDGATVYLPVSGGAVFNTAIALGRLGEEAAFFSGISEDLFGDQLLASLSESGVGTDLCVMKPLGSTLAFVKLTNGQAQYSFFDENSAGRSLDISDLPEFSDNVSALHFGAISLIPEPCGSAYEELLMREAPDKVISLDPNIRTGFIKDAEAHRGRISRMVAKSDIVKVSDEDLDWIAGSKNAGSNLIEEWLEQGVSAVIFTKGSDGVDLFTSSGMISVPAVKTEVVDTVGAGDTFNAGFLSGLNRQGLLTKSALKTASQDDLRTAAELAVKVAAITVSRAGANPPWANEL